jgi:hypothetical protein
VVRARLRGDGVRGMVAATAAAAVVFSVSRIPLRIHQGYHGLDLITTLVVAALGGALVSFCVLAIGAIAWIELSARHSGHMPLRRTPR